MTFVSSQKWFLDSKPEATSLFFCAKSQVVPCAPGVRLLFQTIALRLTFSFSIKRWVQTGPTDDCLFESPPDNCFHSLGP